MRKWSISLTLLLIMIFLTGCAGIRLPSLPTPKRPDTLYNYSETQTSKPTAVVTNGKVIVVTETEKTVRIGLKIAPKKVTFAERIGGWISGLGLIAVIALIVGLVLAPGATIAFLFKVVRKWKRAMRETVVAIKESKAVTNGNGLDKSLSSRQSEETKKIVGNIKASP